MSLLWAGHAWPQGLSSLSNDPFNILDPDEAFQSEVVVTADFELEVSFRIEPGYYLYRDKILVSLDSRDRVLEEISRPDGYIHNDDFFGDTATYRDQATIVSQVVGANYGDTLSVRLDYQGCADAGICYPPQSRHVDVTVPDASAAGKTNGLRAILTNSDEPDLLPPEIAFLPSVVGQNGNQLTIRFAIEPGYYLYKDKMGASLPAGDGRIESIELTEGRLKHDEFFGDVEIYRERADMTLTLSATDAAYDTTLTLAYQGCADIGVCFPPQSTLIPLQLTATTTRGALSGTDNLPTAIGLAATTSRPMAVAAQQRGSFVTRNTAPQTEQDRLASTLSTSGVWVIITTFFGLGLLLAFTPCVFPMVPILSSLIVGQGRNITTGKAISLASVYVLAMALTYTVAGIIVGLSGENIQVWFQNPWVLSAFALLFSLLALSMFGFYELQMPTAIQQRLNAFSNRQRAGTYLGAAVMGLLSALVVGPCVTAPLVGALIFIADTGDAAMGGLALFSLSLGMGTPLLLIGASAGRLLPRAGAWMEKTKAVFGVLMLAMAIWMLSRFIPASATLTLAAALAIVSGIFLGATDSLSPAASGWRRVFKSAGIMAVLYGVTLFIGALSGGHSLLQPLKSLIRPAAITDSVVSNDKLFRPVVSVTDLTQQVAAAAASNRPVMLDFYADWCVSCKEMEAFTFSDPAVQQRMSNIVLLQADVTQNNADDKALLKKFKLFGPPALIFYDRTGQEIRSARLVGFMPAEPFSRHLDSHL